MLRGDGEGAAVRFSLAKAEPLLAELEAFCRCVLDDTPEPVSAHDGVKRSGRGARRARVGRGAAPGRAARHPRTPIDAGGGSRDPLRHPGLQRGREHPTPARRPRAGRARARRPRDHRRRRLDRRHRRRDPRARRRTCTWRSSRHTVNRGLGDGDQHRHPRRAQRVLRRRRDRHARGRHDLRPLRPAAHAGGVRPGHRRRARLGLRARRQDHRRRRLAPRGEQIGLQHLPLSRRAARTCTRSPRSTASTGPARCARRPTPTATCSSASPASPPTSSCC